MHKVPPFSERLPNSHAMKEGSGCGRRGKVRGLIPCLITPTLKQKKRPSSMFNIWLIHGMTKQVIAAKLSFFHLYVPPNKQNLFFVSVALISLP